VIVCTVCGHPNSEGDAFCGTCGSFLQFSGEHLADEPAGTVPPPVDEEDASRPTFVERVKAVVRGERELDALEPSPTPADRRAEGDGARGFTGTPSGLDDGTNSVVLHEAAAAQRAAVEATRVAAAAAAAAEAEAERAAAAQAHQQHERAALSAAEHALAEARARATGSDDGADDDRMAMEAAEETRRRAEAEAREISEHAARTAAEAAQHRAVEQAKAADAARNEAEDRAREAEKAARAAALVARSSAIESLTDVPPPAGAPSATASTVAPGAAVANDPAQPPAVRPGRPARKRRGPDIPVPEVINPGDVICRSCAAGNETGRQFCRRCGTPLALPAPPAPLPWWRRVLRRKPKPRPAAGTRAGAGGATPRGLRRRGQGAVLKSRSMLGKLGRLIAVLAVLGVVGLSVGPWRDAIEDQWQKIGRLISPEYEHIRPVSAVATSSLDGHPAEAVIDQITNSYWAEGADGSGEGQGLTFTFAQQVDLDRIGFHNGASEAPEDFIAQPRLREVQVVFDDGTTDLITLSDEAEFQAHGIKARGVTTVQLLIVSVYPSLGGGDAALAEVEFWTKE
jgi:hypothetical protein